MRTCVVTNLVNLPESLPLSDFTYHVDLNKRSSHILLECNLDAVVICCEMPLVSLGSLVSLIRLKMTSGAGIIVLVEDLAAEARVELMKSGADIIEEFGTSTFLLKAYASAFHRRRCFSSQYSRRFLALEVNRLTYVISVHGNHVRLTKTEYEIAALFIELNAFVVSREMLFQIVFGKTHVSERNLDVHVCILRRKLSRYGYTIINHRLRGYQIGELAQCLPRLA